MSKSARVISIITFIIAIAGLTGQLMALLPLPFSSRIMYNVQGFMSSLNLSFFNMHVLNFYSSYSGISLNYLNTFFYALLLSGAVIYSVSKQRETRLIRFVMAVILLCNVFQLVFAVFFHFAARSRYESYDITWYLIVLNEIKAIILIIASYYVIIKLNKEKELENTVTIDEDGEEEVTGNASNWQRMGHLLIDTYVCVFIFSQSLTFMAEPALRAISEFTDERTALTLMFIVSTFLYYPFFETLFGATPAKFLTETRVLTTDNKKAGFATILGRTLARRIPLNAFSFLFMTGWHDGITRTKVVREKQTGVKGRRYLLIFPVLLFIILLVFIGNEIADRRKSFVYYRNEHNEKIADIIKRLETLNNSDIIKITDISDPFPSGETYLKIENTSNGVIEASVISKEDDYTRSLAPIEKYYREKTDSLKRITIKKEDLDNAFTPDYSDYRHGKKNAAPLLGDSRLFEIENIERLFEPDIHDRGTGSFGSYISMDFLNYGWPARVIELQTLEGSIEWNDSLPLDAPVVKELDYPDFTLNGSNYNRGEKYKFRMVVEDTTGRRQTYIVEGRNLEKKILKTE